MHLQTHLTRRGQLYWFRARVPVDLLEQYAPRREFKISLRTRDPREAREKARLEAVKLDQEFADARRKRDSAPANTLSETEIRRLEALYFHERLLADDEVRMNGFGDREVFAAVRQQLDQTDGLSIFTDEQATARFGLGDRDVNKIREASEWMLPMLKEALSRGDASVVEEEAQDFLAAEGIKLDADSEA